MSFLYLPHGLVGQRWWRAYRRLDRLLGPELPAVGERHDYRLERAYAALLRELVRAGAGSLPEALARALVVGVPPFGPRSGASAPDAPAPGALELLKRDAGVLMRVARRDLAAEVASATGRDMPAATGLCRPSGHAGVERLAAGLVGLEPDGFVGLYLDELRESGGGPAALHSALAWEGDRLSGIANPDAADWADLVGLGSQLERLAANTEALLAGAPAQDVLLYGARGSGKSTAVRGLLRRYAERGLRLVEVKAGDLARSTQLLDALRHKPQAFVLYVDDLSFDEGDKAYRPLKTLLEGGLVSRPANVVVYATSNRRHLISERFSDRPTLADDDVHRWDTQHERLALADRFGLTLTFPDATQRRYLELVSSIAERHGVRGEGLEEAALRFAEWGNGYSGRTARQFVETRLTQPAEVKG